jgi:hypothetical protein
MSVFNAVALMSTNPWSSQPSIFIISCGAARDRTRPILQHRDNVLARAPSTRELERTALATMLPI